MIFSINTFFLPYHSILNVLFLPFFTYCIRSSNKNTAIQIIMLLFV